MEGKEGKGTMHEGAEGRNGVPVHRVGLARGRNFGNARLQIGNVTRRSGILIGKMRERKKEVERRGRRTETRVLSSAMYARRLAPTGFPSTWGYKQSLETFNIIIYEIFNIKRNKT